MKTFTPEEKAEELRAHAAALAKKHGTCSCGHSIKTHGVGYWTRAGWICKKCGELHTPTTP